MKKAILEIWRGERGLAFTFWLIFWLPTFLFNSAIQADRRNDIPLILILIGFGYFIFASLSAWRSARKHPTKHIGSILAQILIAICWLSTAYQLLLVVITLIER